MARYTCTKTVSLPLKNVYSQLQSLLDGFGLEVLFSQRDRLIAREIPGQVPFTKLVTIEVLVDNKRNTTNATQMDVIVTNEELPFQNHNHCSQIFSQLNEALDFHLACN